MAVDLVGRDEQLGSLLRFLERADDGAGPSAIALEGEAGIGKSTLWRAAVDAARQRGARVLIARPLESERLLPYAGLGDLLGGVIGEVRHELTAPQRRALDVALLLEDAEGQAVDALALGVAVRAALERLAADALLLAIDDLQWLDQASAGALGFALRRLSGSRVLVLWARRTGESAPRSPVEEAFDSDRVERVEVGPLSVGALQQVLRGRLSHPMPRPRLLRVHEVSDGNPLYAIELARALEGSAGDPTQPLAVPERLEELLSARLAGLDDSTRAALVLAAAHPRLSTDQLRAAGVDPAVLEPALAEGVIELEHTTVRFTHPLLASVLYQRLSPAGRHQAHARLAGLVDDPVAAARHLALSTDAPDPVLAGKLEEAATAAGDQGAPIVAAELGEHALRLTPADHPDDLRQRTIATARAHAAAGEGERARLLAEELVSRTQPGPERAEALTLLADLELDEIHRGIQLLEEALREPGAPAGLRVHLHHRLSLSTRFTAGLEPADEHARAAVALAEELGDTALLAEALSGLALIRFNAGQADALELAERAYGLIADEQPPPVDVVFALVHVLVWSLRLTPARELLNQCWRSGASATSRSPPTRTGTWGSWSCVRAGSRLLASTRSGRTTSASSTRETATSPRRAPCRSGSCSPTGAIWNERASWPSASSGWLRSMPCT